MYIYIYISEQKLVDLKEFNKVSNKTIEIDGCLNKWATGS